MVRIFSVFALLIVALPVRAQPVSSHDQPIAFVNINVLPMDSEQVLEGQTVVVEDGRITMVGPTAAVQIPEEAFEVDGEGRYLLPGLAEMHGHIPPPTAPQAYIDAVLFLYVANGITTVRGMLGHENQLELREQANSNQILAPTLYLAGPSFNGQSVNSPEQAVEMVHRQVEEGWNLLKVHPGPTRAEYDAMAEAANEAGIRFGGHVPADVGLMHALEMGQETFDHIDGYVEYVRSQDDEEQAIEEAVQATREAGAWVVPTMVLWEVLNGTSDLEELMAYDELKYMPPDDVATWQRQFEQRVSSSEFDRAEAQAVIDLRMRILRALNEGGVKILMGTDAPQQFSVPGFSLHRELPRMEEAGMTPYEILVSGTRNVGDYFANEDQFGRVAEGMRADLLVLEANPLDDIGHLQQRAGVMTRGRWLPEAFIQERLEEIAARY